MTITTFSPFRRTLTIQFSLRNIGYTVFVVFLFYLVLVLDSFSGVQQYLPQKMPSPITLSGLFFCIMLIAGRNLTYAARIQAEQHGTTNTLTPADTWRYRCGILLLLLLMLPLSLSLGKITVHLVTLANDPVIVSLDPGIKTVPRGSVLLRTLAFAPNLLLPAVMAALLPAINLSYLHDCRITAMYNPARLWAAVRTIGGHRYLTIAAINILMVCIPSLLLTLPFIIYWDEIGTLFLAGILAFFLGEPQYFFLMLLFMFIIGFISYAASSLFLSFPAIYAAWFYPAESDIREPAPRITGHAGIADALHRLTRLISRLRLHYEADDRSIAHQQTIPHRPFFTTVSGTLLYLIHPSTLLILLFSAAIVALGTLIETILPLRTYIPLPTAIYSPTLLLTSILSTTLLAGQALNIAARIRSEEPLPDTVMRPYYPTIALILLGISLLHSIIRQILTDNAIPTIPADIAMAGVFVFLLPLVNLVYLREQNITSLFSPRKLLQALHDIGELRYFAVTAPGLALVLFLPQRLPVTYTDINALYTLLAIPAFYSLCSGICWLLAVTYPAWYYPPEDDAAEDDDDADPPAPIGFAATLVHAEAAIHRGDTTTAITLLTPYTDAQHDPAIYHPAYRLLYPIAPSDALRTRLINAAISGSSESYDIITADLARLDPAQLPAAYILPLSKQAYARHAYPAILNLTRNFAKNHPSHPHLIENYYLAALALAKTGAADKALSLLQQLHTRYPDHPRATTIAQVIAHLQGKP